MADWYMSVAGAGGKTGADWANREDFSQANLQAAVDQLTAGDTLYLEAETYTLTASIDCDGGAGSYGSYKTIMALNGSGVEDNSQAILDGNSAATNVLTHNNTDYWRFLHLDMIGATGDIWAGTGTNSQYITFYNCNFDNAGADGYSSTTKDSTDAILIHCEANSNSGHGFEASPENDFIYCQAIENGARGFSPKDSHIIGCLAHANTTDGFAVGTTLKIANCISDDNGGNGINLNSHPSEVSNCRMTNNGGYGLVDSAVCGLSFNNFYYGNTSGEESITYSIETIGKVTGTSDGYADQSNDDFTLTAGGEGVGISTPYGNLAESTNVGYPTAGMPPDPNGGSGGGRQTRFQIRGA